MPCPGQLVEQVRTKLSSRSREHNPHDSQLPNRIRFSRKIRRKTRRTPADSRPTEPLGEQPGSAHLLSCVGNVGAAAMDIRNVPLNDLVLDPNLNLRDRLDDFTVERYADSWDRLPPITVYEIDGKWLVADGFHRHAAAVMLGKRTIPAEIRVGTFTDALDFVSSVNLFHGLPLTRSERRRAVEIKLKLHHDWSDRRMAEELAVSRELVAKIRRQLIEGNQIPNNPGRVGSDGKLYTSAGIPREQPERPKAKPETDEDDSTERGRRGMGAAAAPPREETVAPKAKGKGCFADEIHWAGWTRRLAIAPSGPIDVSAPTIDELLELMSRQIMQVITWTQADGFLDSYRSASRNARGLFHCRRYQAGRPGRSTASRADEAIRAQSQVKPWHAERGRRGTFPPA